MSTYHLPTEINGKDTLAELDRIADLLSLPASRVSTATVVELRTDHPVLIALANSLLDQDIEQTPPAPAAKKPRTPRKPKAEAAMPADDVTVPELAEAENTGLALPTLTVPIEPSETPQNYNWLLPNGTQTNSLVVPIRKGLVKAGDTVVHIQRGPHILVQDGDRLTAKHIRQVTA